MKIDFHTNGIRQALRALTVWGACVMVTSVQAASLQVTVLDKEGKPVPEAVVVVVPAAKGEARNPPPLQAVISQEKMQFIPVVTLVSPGAKIRFVNNDPWDHHVRVSAPALASGGNLAAAGLAPGAMYGISLRPEGKSEGKMPKTADVTLDKPGATGAMLMGCFIHGSMSGFVYVADSPWTVKTGADGIALLDDVPDGAVSVKVWHATQLVEAAPQNMTLGVAPSKITLHVDAVLRRRRS